MIQSPEADQLALAIVVALHRGDTAAAAALLSAIEWDDLVGIAVVLAAALDEAWTELCERDAVDFTEFVQESGLWLAEKEQP